MISAATGVPNPGDSLRVIILGVSEGKNRDHRLAGLDCWNVDLLADLAEVIPVIL